MVEHGNRRGIGSMRQLIAGGALAVLLVSTATCLGPSVGEGEIACGAGEFCPPGYTCGGDSRCYRDEATAPDGAPAADAAPGHCGDGVIGPGETCEAATCPADCRDGNACTIDTMTGDAATCDAVCVRTYIETCLAESDGCCPGGCQAQVPDGPNFDPDCSTTCGDGNVDPGESCDPKETCPTSCDDTNPCTADTLTGSPENCNAACVHEAISACGVSEGCCPAGCESTRDPDCSATCNDGHIDDGETCDPISTCPATCDDRDPCTSDVATGAAATCNLVCSNTPVTACQDGDGCCPAGCTANDDSECVPVCGNGVTEPGEICDPACTCGDGNACTSDVTLGTTTPTCNPWCNYKEITVCNTGDGCCPAGCSAMSTDTSTLDLDCACPCGAADGCCPGRSACDGDPDCG